MRTAPSGAWGLLLLALGLPLDHAQEPATPGPQLPDHIAERIGYLEAQIEGPEVHPADDLEALQEEVLRLADELDQVWDIVHQQEPEGELGPFALAVKKELARRDGLEALDQAEIARLRAVVDDLGAKFDLYHQLAEDNAAQADRLHDLFLKEQRSRRWDRLGCAFGVGLAGDQDGTKAGLALACGLKF